MTYCDDTVDGGFSSCNFSPAVSTGQKYIYTGCDLGRIIIYDLLTGKIVHTLHSDGDYVNHVSWHPYSPEIISIDVSKNGLMKSHTTKAGYLVKIL